MEERRNKGERATLNSCGTGFFIKFFVEFLSFSTADRAVRNAICEERKVRKMDKEDNKEIAKKWSHRR